MYSTNQNISLVPSAPVQFDSAFYQPGDNLILQTSQPRLIYQPQPIMINNDHNQGLFNQSFKNNHHNNQWSSELCNCFSDFGECCFAFFCPFCYQIRLFNKANETCCSCIFGGLVPLRTKIRMKNNIQGSICSDYCTVYWCTICSVVQMGIELKKNETI